MLTSPQTHERTRGEMHDKGGQEQMGHCLPAKPTPEALLGAVASEALQQLLLRGVSCRQVVQSSSSKRREKMGRREQARSVMVTFPSCMLAWTLIGMRLATWLRLLSR